MKPKRAALLTVACGSAGLALLILWSKLSFQRGRYWSWGPDAFGVLIEFCALSLGAAGVLSILKAVISPLAGRQGSETLRIFPEMTLRNVLPLRRRSEAKPMASLPNFGLACGVVILVPFIDFAIFELAHGRTGLWMQIQQREIARQRTSPWGETLSIYVDQTDRFFVNGEPIKRDDLRPRLQAELATKPMAWSVYFEAHPDAQFQDAVFAFDTIQELNARAIWITPRMREEWKREGVETLRESGRSRSSRKVRSEGYDLP